MKTKNLFFMEGKDLNRNNNKTPHNLVQNKKRKNIPSYDGLIQQT